MVLENGSSRFSKGRTLPSFRAFEDPLRAGGGRVRRWQTAETTASGSEVDLDNVLEVETILACVRVLSESIACLPLDLYVKNEKEGATKALDHPLYELIRWQPNDETTAYEFWQWLVIDAIIRGAGYAQIRWSGSGENRKVVDLWPLCAKRVRPARAPASEGGRLFYTYCPEASTTSKKRTGEVMLEAYEVLRIQVLPSGGLIPWSIIDLQKEAVGANIASAQYTAEFFANGGVVSGVIEIPEEMSEPAYRRLKDDWANSHSKKGTRHGVPILESGAKFNPVALDHEETQLIETRKFQRSSLAGLFRVPAHMINDLEKATFSNIEHQDIGFVKHALRPWMTNIQQRCRMSLLNKKEKRDHIFKHNDRDLLRGDFPSRATAYSTLVNCGVMSPNDARDSEDMNRYPGGDRYLVNGTLVDVTKVGEQSRSSLVPPESSLRTPPRGRK